MRNSFIPTGALRRTLTLLAMVAALAAVGRGLAQSAPADAAKHFSKDATFHLPISIDDKMRANIKEVQLWMKTTSGEWQKSQTAPPLQQSFKFKAATDGEYWFALVTVDNKGGQRPADMNRLSPQEIVVVIVDTQPPTFDLQPMKVANGEFLLRCSVTDANPDPKSLKITYQGADQSTRTLEQLPGQPGMYRVPGPEIFASPLRVTVSDVAENSTNRDVNLQESVAKLMPAPQVAPIVQIPQPPPQVQTIVQNPQGNSNVQQVSGQQPTSLGTVVVSNSSAPLPPPNNITIIESRPAPINMQPASVAPIGSVPRQLLNTPRASLDYRIEVGPSGVGKVEVWMTTDQGASWKRFCEDADRRSPAEFDLPGDGLYGVRVVVTNGNGFGGRPPVSGEQPQMWVEVDTIAPIAQLREVEPVANGGSLDIRWTASDKNLGGEPVNLLYATRREGPWLPIARGVKNDGLYRWAFPRDGASQFFIRLEVADQSGNLARCDSQNPIALDMTEPRATVVGVSGIGRPQ